jgi:hypothetical protein
MAADSVGYSEGSGKKIATDTIPVFDSITTGMPVDVEHQRVKLTTGPDGFSEGDVSSIHPMPVDDPYGRRMQEASFLLQQVQAMATTASREMYSSNRRGFEYGTIEIR